MTDLPTPSDAPARVRLNRPADVLATVPYLLGFHPEDSLVVLSLRGSTDRVGLCARVDLPPPGATLELAEQLTRHLVRDGARAALLVSYLADGAEDIRADVALACAAAFERAGVRVRDAFRVRDGSWWSYLCEERACCPPEGSPVPSPDASPAAAEAVLSGAVVWPDRARAAGVLAPPVGDDADRMRAVLDRVVAEPDASGPATRRTVVALRRVTDALDRLADPRATLPDDDVARIAVLLADRAVRDEVALWAAGERGQRVQRMLVDVVQRVPPPCDVDPAAALACVAYQRGEGMLARTAIERALASDPDHRLTRMLESALDAGIPPSAIAESRARARVGRPRRGTGTTPRR